MGPWFRAWVYATYDIWSLTRTKYHEPKMISWIIIGIYSKDPRFLRSISPGPLEYFEKILLVTTSSVASCCCCYNSCCYRSSSSHQSFCLPNDISAVHPAYLFTDSEKAKNKNREWIQVIQSSADLPGTRAQHPNQQIRTTESTNTWNKRNSEMRQDSNDTRTRTC